MLLDANYELVDYLETNLSNAELSDIIDVIADPLKDLVHKDEYFGGNSA